MPYELPRLPADLAPRDGLMKKIDRAARKRIVVFSADAGAGKTMSALQWLKLRGPEGRYLRLDGSADAPAEFRRVLRAAADGIESGGALVIDDFQAISSREILKELPELLSVLGCVILLLTRDEPCDALRELIDSGRASLITGDDLAFSAEETAAYLASRSYRLSEGENAAVYALTGGWPMGESAVAVSGSFALGQGGGRELSVYFPGHIWDGWGRELRDFWLKTAVAPELTAELGFRLTGRSDCETLLTGLSEINSFVLRIDADTYVYQSLFREFLLKKLAGQGLDTDELRRTAAEYYMERAELYNAWTVSLEADYEAGIDAVLRELLNRALARPDEAAGLLGAYIRLCGAPDNANFKNCLRLYEYLMGLSAEAADSDLARGLTWNMPLPHRAGVSGETPLADFLLRAGELYERSRLSEAKGLSEQAIAALGPDTPRNLAVSAFLLRAAIAYSVDDMDVFREYIDRAKAENGQNLDVAAFEAKYVLMNASRSDADMWLRLAAEPAEPPEFYKLYVHFATARAYIVLNRAGEALELLGKLKALAEAYGRPADAAEASALIAAVKWRSGDRDSAADTLRYAVKAMRPLGYMRLFADEGAALLPILKKLESEGAETDKDFVAEICRLAAIKARRSRGVTWNLVRSEVKLSKRQKLMLELLAQGLSQAEISEQTGLAIPTVKSHLYAAYNKLGASNSRTAVAKAAELGFI